MASNFVPNADDTKEEQHLDFHHHHHQGHHHHHYQAPSPRGQGPSPRGVRRTWSSNSSACGQGAAAVPKCVCAPATHANSFKCRLHRTNSHGHSPPSPTAVPPPPPGPVNSSRHPTVEAQ